MHKIRYLSISPELEGELNRLFCGELKDTRKESRKSKAIAWIAVGAAVAAALTVWAWLVL